MFEILHHNLQLIPTMQRHLDHVHIKLAKFINKSFSLCFGPPSRLKQHFSPLKWQLSCNVMSASSLEEEEEDTQ